MALKISQQIKQSQSLTMTPQMQQAIKLLTIPHIEMIEVINNELVANPILDETPSYETSPINKSEGEVVGIETDYFNQQNILSSKENDFDWSNYASTTNPSNYSPISESHQGPTASRVNNSEEDFNYENIVSKETGLSDYLFWQIKMENLTPDEELFASNVIYNLNENGFLEIPIEELIKNIKINIEDAQEILKMIQKCDPVGCATYDIQESLIIQAKCHESPNPLAIIILENYFTELEKQNFSHLISSEGLLQDEIHLAISFIQTLSPRPGKSLSTSPPQYVIPDVYVKEVNGQFVVFSNEEGIPSLKVSKYYEKLLVQLKNRPKSLKDKEAINYIQEKIDSAHWLIKTINIRKKTISRVAESIVKKQQDFFLKGPKSLRPMILKDIANELGIHESTISRSTMNKFMHTPLGIFEFKYFFNAGIGGKMGGVDISPESLKSKIQKMISIEPSKHPLSDQNIAEILQKEGIHVARRTVAKYRELLGIPSSSERKNKKSEVF